MGCGSLVQLRALGCGVSDLHVLHLAEKKTQGVCSQKDASGAEPKPSCSLEIIPADSAVRKINIGGGDSFSFTGPESK